MISANRVHVQYLVITIAIMLRISTSQPSIQIVWPTYRIPFLLNATIRFEIDSQNFRLDEEFDLLFGKLNELLSFCCREATLANFSECPPFCFDSLCRTLRRRAANFLSYGSRHSEFLPCILLRSGPNIAHASMPEISHLQGAACFRFPLPSQ